MAPLIVTQTQAQHFPRFYAQAGHLWTPNFYYVNSSQCFAIFGMQWSLFTGLDLAFADVARTAEAFAQDCCTAHPTPSCSDFFVSACVCANDFWWDGDRTAGVSPLSGEPSDER